MISFSLIDDSYASRCAMCHWPSSAWPHLEDSVCVEVYKVHAGWYVRADYDVRSGARQSWIRGGLYPTRDAAAAEASDLFAECVRLMLALHRGETLRTPRDVMSDAWNGSDEANRLREAYEVALARRAESLSSDDAWRAGAVAVGVAKAALEDAYAAWSKAQDWRNWRDLGAPIVHRDIKPGIQAGQLPLLEVA